MALATGRKKCPAATYGVDEAGQPSSATIFLIMALLRLQKPGVVVVLSLKRN